MFLLFSELFLTFFFLISLSGCHFCPFLSIFSQGCQIYDCGSMSCVQWWGALEPAESPCISMGFRDSPSLFPQGPVLSLLAVNTWPQPSHTVSYLPRHCYHQQASLYVGYGPLCFTLYVILPLFKLVFMSGKTSARNKIIETAQGRKATGWKVQEYCYFPYSTTIPFSVLREDESSDPHHCLDHLFGLTLSVTELCTHKNYSYFEDFLLHFSSLAV